MIPRKLRLPAPANILIAMNELGEIWQKMLAEAEVKARTSGRNEVAEYLALKAANDIVRNAGVRWLFDSLVEIASHANRVHRNISIERDDPHSFTNRGANIVGSRLRILQGVRCLAAEAGWTRTPADGFMRGGALAVGRLSHFGMPKRTAELILISRSDGPAWLAVEEDNERSEFGLDRLKRQFDVFLS